MPALGYGERFTLRDGLRALPRDAFRNPLAPTAKPTCSAVSPSCSEIRRRPIPPRQAIAPVCVQKLTL